jgi:TPP-dependent 2-oxoacid decarboxylase
MKAQSVAQYSLARLSQLGIDKIFGVPGDYAFSIDDAVEQIPGLEWVASVNELNEDVISERGHGYDDLADVKYHLLPEAFGCKGWLSSQVRTIAELDEILEKIESHDGAVYIEVMIPNEESQPLPDEVIDSGYKLRTPSVG